MVNAIFCRQDPVTDDVVPAIVDGRGRLGISEALAQRTVLVICQRPMLSVVLHLMSEERRLEKSCLRFI
jgi:hypothetical protein